MLRTSYGGRRRDEGLAGKTLAEVKEIQAILKANAERGVPPFFYRDLRLMAHEQALAQAIRQDRERKALIAEEKKASQQHSHPGLGKHLLAQTVKKSGQIFRKRLPDY